MPLPRPTRASSATATPAKATSHAGGTRAPAASRARALPDPLVALRAAFLSVVARDTPGSDLARYTEVLDELLAWAAAHADRVAAGTGAAAPGVIAFTPVTGVVGPRWSVRPIRGEGPVVEVLPAPGAQQDAQNERLRAVFNAHSRAVLGPDSRPRIGFGALKNPAARAAVLAVLEDLLREPAADAPADPSVDAPDAAQPALSA